MPTQMTAKMGAVVGESVRAHEGMRVVWLHMHTQTHTHSFFLSLSRHQLTKKWQENTRKLPLLLIHPSAHYRFEQSLPHTVIQIFTQYVHAIVVAHFCLTHLHTHIHSHLHNHFA